MKIPKWIPLKQWRIEEAMREHLTEHAIEIRLLRGKYPKLKIKRVNARVVLVGV